MNYDEVDAYHPRYSSTEYLMFEALERKRKKRAIAFGLISLFCFAAVVYFVR